VAVIQWPKRGGRKLRVRISVPFQGNRGRGGEKRGGEGGVVRHPLLGVEAFPCIDAPTLPGRRGRRGKKKEGGGNRNHPAEGRGEKCCLMHKGRERKRPFLILVTVTTFLVR